MGQIGEYRQVGDESQMTPGLGVNCVQEGLARLEPSLLFGGEESSFPSGDALPLGSSTWAKKRNGKKTQLEGLGSKWRQLKSPFIIIRNEGYLEVLFS